MSIQTQKLSELDIGILQTFVDGARLLGLPRSVGEIYGLLYISEEPLCLEQITSMLQISSGSASQGLKQLKIFKAVRKAYVPGDRREYYQAEAELRKLIAGYMREEIRPHLLNVQQRLDDLEHLLPEAGEPGAEHLRNRFSALRSWHAKSARWLKRVSFLIK